MNEFNIKAIWNTYHTSFNKIQITLTQVPVSPAETAAAMQPNISHMTNQMAQMHIQHGGGGGGGSQYIISGGYPATATHQGSWQQMSQQSHPQTQIQVRQPYKN